MERTHTVYVLHSKKHDKIYIGCTSNLEERFKSHNELGTKGWTVKFRALSNVHTEEFETKPDARRREKQLKSAAARRWIREELIDE